VFDLPNSGLRSKASLKEMLIESENSEKPPQKGGKIEEFFMNWK